MIRPALTLSLLAAATLIVSGCDRKQPAKDTKSSTEQAAKPAPEPAPPLVEPTTCAGVEAAKMLLPSGVESIQHDESWETLGESKVTHVCAWVYAPGTVDESTIDKAIGRFVNELGYESVDLTGPGALRIREGIETQVSGSRMPIEGDERVIFMWTQTARTNALEPNPAHATQQAEMQRFLDALPAETQIAALLAAKLTELDMANVEARFFADHTRYELNVAPLNPEGITAVTKWLDAAGIEARTIDDKPAKPAEPELGPAHFYRAAGSFVWMAQVTPTKPSPTEPAK